MSNNWIQQSIVVALLTINYNFSLIDARSIEFIICIAIKNSITSQALSACVTFWKMTTAAKNAGDIHFCLHLNKELLSEQYFLSKYFYSEHLNAFGETFLPLW